MSDSSTMQLAAFVGRSARLSGLAMAALLAAACTTTPLPPWPAPGSDPAVHQPAVPAAPVDAAAAQDYSEAVAARFPDPAVRYQTPGLQPGRTTFTTNAELRQFLHDVTTRAAAGVTARVQAIGQSQRGQPIEALYLARGGDVSPSAFMASGKPTVLFIGQQHGNEPAASEAMLVVAEQLASGSWSNVLAQLNVIIVPRANPDGAEQATRTLANRIDLNRDHLLLRSPEARALAKLTREYRPLVIVDSHEFTVAGRFQQKFQGVQAYDAMLQYANTPNIGEFIVKASDEWFALSLFEALGAESLRTQWYFTTSADMQDLTLAMGGTRADTGRNVNGLKNAVSLLVETRGIGIGRMHLQRRVHAHVVAAHTVLEQAALRGNELMQVQAFVERDVAAQACRGRLVIDAQQPMQSRDITLLDPVTGADIVRTLPWRSSLQLQPTVERNRPCGYLIANAETDAVARLQMLGLAVWRVAEPGTLQVERYNEIAREQAERLDVRGVIDDAQGEHLRVQVALTGERAEVPSGSFYVPLGQPLAHLAVAALEPDTQSSFFANRVLRDLGSLVRVIEPPALIFEELE
ncbi:hypothetical protein AAV94_04895 [Lampropedia cohaerens]|uniref:Peptidase M14 domain-containing protein n=1 Tax=Lampropedia cohaerens TaxID=1610491 RepID=A0A0U1Q129_9BURK|nr:M14 family metallopeptidase [Lampropedia cohaerens]KKW68441.1 hypothetical protein AAV94_04895 [Lampropedia cohaerens]